MASKTKSIKFNIRTCLFLEGGKLVSTMFNLGMNPKMFL